MSNPAAAMTEAATNQNPTWQVTHRPGVLAGTSPASTRISKTVDTHPAQKNNKRWKLWK
jgi:hypothetical protein